MIRPTCKIDIGKVSIDWVHGIEVVSSWKQLTDTAVVKLPANVILNERKSAEETRHAFLENIHFNDVVTIELGYDNVFTTVFKGYVTDIKTGVPIEILCEDEMYQFKQNNIVDSEGETIPDLMKRHFPGVNIKALDLNVGKYAIDNLNGAQLLEKLQSDYSVYSFFRNGELIVGNQYNAEKAKTHQFKLEYDMISEELEYRKADQVKLHVKAIYSQPDGETIEATAGDDSGDTRVIHTNTADEKQLEEIAKAELSRLSYDGWRGKFTAFGRPTVQHGDIVELLYTEGNSDKTGKYFVDTVRTTFGLSGFRQEIELGPKV